jgi:hypothetical protein
MHRQGGFCPPPLGAPSCKKTAKAAPAKKWAVCWSPWRDDLEGCQSFPGWPVSLEIRLGIAFWLLSEKQAAARARVGGDVSERRGW